MPRPVTLRPHRVRRAASPTTSAVPRRRWPRWQRPRGVPPAVPPVGPQRADDTTTSAAAIRSGTSRRWPRKLTGSASTRAAAEGGCRGAVAGDREHDRQPMSFGDDPNGIEEQVEVLLRGQSGNRDEQRHPSGTARAARTAYRSAVITGSVAAGTTASWARLAPTATGHARDRSRPQDQVGALGDDHLQRSVDRCAHPALGSRVVQRDHQGTPVRANASTARAPTRRPWTCTTSTLPRRPAVRPPWRHPCAGAVGP